MKQALEGSLNGILGYPEHQVVSSVFNSAAHPASSDAGAGIVLNNNSVKLISCHSYDNEYRYSNRVVEGLRGLQGISSLGPSTWKEQRGREGPSAAEGSLSHLSPETLSTSPQSFQSRPTEEGEGLREHCSLEHYQ